MKKLLFSATALTLTGLLLAGCGDESIDDKKETTEKTAISDDKSKAEKEEVIDDFTKDLKAVEGKTTAQKAQYVIKKYPENLTKQTEHIAGFARKDKKTYDEEDYKKMLQAMLKDYLSEGYKEIDNRKSSLLKIYSGVLLEKYGEDEGIKEMTKFGHHYRTIVSDYYRGYDKNDKTKSFVESDQRLVDGAFDDLMELVD